MIIEWSQQASYAQLPLYQNLRVLTWNSAFVTPAVATGEQGAYYYRMYPQIIVFGIGLGILFHLLSISL